MATDIAVTATKRKARKVMRWGCLGTILTLGLPALLLFGTVAAMLALGDAYQQSVTETSTNLVTPMPSLATALQNPAYKAIIVAAQTAAGVPAAEIGTAQGVNPRMQLLLSMAWVDSQWGTNSGANPILSGSTGVVAAEAAIAAGLDPSSQGFVYALAISHAESGWNPDIGNCNGVAPPANDIIYSPTGTNAAWNACTSAVMGDDGTPESLDDGIWQINTPTDAGYNGWSRDALTDPLTNAKAMMVKSSNGTNWGPWCTAWSGGTCGVGTLLGCPGSSYCAYMALAEQIQAQVSGQSLGSTYSGIILMLTSEWNSLLPGQDPSTDATGVMNTVQQQLAATTGTDPTAWTGSLDNFYNIGVTPANTTSVPDHVALVVQVDQMGFGALSDLNAKVLAEAQSQIGKPCSTYAPPEWCPGPPPDTPEWCAYFVSWVFQQAGVNIPTESLADSIATWGSASSTLLPPSTMPEPGDAVVWTYRTGPAYGQHTAIIDMVQATSSGFEIQTIDGNNDPNVVTGPQGWINPQDPPAGFGNSGGSFVAMGYTVP